MSDAPPRLVHDLPLFPATVQLFDLPQAETLNPRLDRAIRKLRRRQPTWKGRTSPWQCAPVLHEDPQFEPLSAAVLAAGGLVLDALALQVERIELTAMWANVLSPGESHRPHSHANNFLSGVYWVSDGS